VLLLALGCAIVWASSRPSYCQFRPDPTGTEAAATNKADNEFLEIVYRGRTVRIPIKAGQPSTLDIGGQKWNIALSPKNGAVGPAATGDGPTLTTAGSSEPPRGMFSDPLTVLVLVCLLLVLAGVLAYFFVLEPIRRRRPLQEALKIIESDQRSQFAKAEHLLDQALLAGLRKKDIAQARFALAYLRSLLSKYEEAATVLADLEKSGTQLDCSAAYLMLWVRGRLKQHERVERIYSEYHGHLAGFLQSELIVSTSYLALARMKWARREINGAMHYFDQVRKLAVLVDEIPNYIDDHEVVMGTVSLFEKNTDEALKHFRAAIEAATKQNKPTHGGSLGLVLCEWREGNLASVDETLGKVLLELTRTHSGNDSTMRTQCTHCGRYYQIRAAYLHQKFKCKSCRRQFVAKKLEAAEEIVDSTSDDQDTQEQLLSEESLLLRNTRLWHCLSLIATWLTRAEKSGLPDDEREKLTHRLNLVTSLDASMGDPYLIGGLINYYLPRSDEMRQEGRTQIARSVELDVHLPEVLQLLDRENKLAQLSEYSVTYFHRMSHDFAKNPEVAEEIRERFVRTMNRFKRFTMMGPLAYVPADSKVAPTLENLQGRGEILRIRVSNIVRHRLTDAEQDVRSSIQRQLDELNDQSQTLAQNTTAFQETELSLMESTGEFLFHDEEPADDDPTPAADHTPE
jgi:tetratricopeptide (TPR) repeat protein